MAKNKNGGADYGISFVVCDLRSDDKPDFEAWCDEYGDDWASLVETTTREAYRLTIKFDFNNSCFMASMTQQDQKHPNANKLLSARAGDPQEAILMVLYKHFRKLAGETWPIEAQNRFWG